MARSYTDEQKAEALELLKTHSPFKVSGLLGIPISTLKTWREKQRYRALRKTIELADLADEIASKVHELLEALSMDRIEQATMQQVASALGMLIDRYLKIRAIIIVQQPEEKAVRIEYLYPDGKIADTPPWSTLDPDLKQALQSSRLWQTLRQDGSGEDHGDGTDAARENGLVAGADLSHGGADLARSESDLQRD